MNTLPEEILMEIFLLLAPVMAATTNGCGTLALVCRRWYYIALENCRLWASVSIRLTTLGEAMSWGRRLPPYLLKSGSLPLDIVVECNYRREPGNTLAESLFAAYFIKVLQNLAVHSARWVSLDLNIGKGIGSFEWSRIEAALSVKPLRLNRLCFAGGSFAAIPLLGALNLQHITLVDIEVENKEMISFPGATRLFINSSKLKTCPPATSITTTSTSLVQLTLSIWEWDETDKLEGTFPCLTSLSLVGGCQLQPGLLESFVAPALEALDIGLWQADDVTELLRCKGIPFSQLTRISLGWTAVEYPLEMFNLLGGMLEQCSSLNLLQVGSSASIQCELTCLLVLLSLLEEVEGGAFNFTINDITESIPNGPERLETRDQLAKKYDLPSLPVHRDEYFTAMELWFLI